MIFWDTVASELKKQKISYADFSRMTGIPSCTLASCICRPSDPGLSRAHIIAHALGVSLEYLLNGVDLEVRRSSSAVASIVEIINNLDEYQVKDILDYAESMSMNSSVSLQAVS